MNSNSVKPLQNAHSHNDYEQKRPLEHALELGFTSIEVDVFCIKGELYVAHTRPVILKKKKTLRKMYLEPLKRRIEANGGQVYKGYDQSLLLMIDIKTDAEKTYKVLRKQLKAYENILTKTKKMVNIHEVKAVTVFLSGNRPIETVRAETVRLCGIDGRPDDLQKNYASNLMPVISQRYSKIIKWNGKGKTKPNRLVLHQLVREAHQQGKKVRLWASPENEKVWKFLREAGVDLINTDELERLRQFLTKS
jgi:glycerophosphoryl diester phosphodiesterase